MPIVASTYQVGVLKTRMTALHDQYAAILAAKGE